MTKSLLVIFTTVLISGCLTSPYYLKEGASFSDSSKKAVKLISDYDVVVNKSVTDYQLSKASQDTHCPIGFGKNIYLRQKKTKLKEIIKSNNDLKNNPNCLLLISCEEKPAIVNNQYCSNIIGANITNCTNLCNRICYSEYEAGCFTEINKLVGIGKLNSLKVKAIEEGKDDEFISNNDNFIELINLELVKEVSSKISSLKLGGFRTYDSNQALEKTVFIGKFLDFIAVQSDMNENEKYEKLQNLVEKAKSLNGNYYKLPWYELPQDNEIVFEEYDDKATKIDSLLNTLIKLSSNYKSKKKIKSIILKNYEKIVSDLSFLSKRAERNKKLVNAITQQKLIELKNISKHKWAATSGQIERLLVLKEREQMLNELSSFKNPPDFKRLSDGVVKSLDTLKDLYTGNPNKEQRKNIRKEAMNQFKNIVGTLIKIKDII